MTQKIKNSYKAENKMNFFYILLIACGCAFIGYAQSDDTVTAVQGEPLILNFEYRGLSLRRVYTKDGNDFQPDRRRTFVRLGRIYFAKALPSDSGAYRLRAGQFYKTFTVNGKYNSICVVE